VISILTLFIVTAASRPVNKNVNTGAVIRAKRAEPSVHELLANYQTGSYKFTPSSWNGKSDRSLSFLNTH